jgi:hypothetical protein
MRGEFESWQWAEGSAMEVTVTNGLFVRGAGQPEGSNLDPLHAFADARKSV